MEQSRWAISTEAPGHTPENFSSEDPSVDQFAQTRQPDDLFDDDFTPIAEPVSQVIPSIAPRSSYTQNRGRGTQPRGRGRGYQSRQAEPHQPTSASNQTNRAQPIKTPDLNSEDPSDAIHTTESSKQQPSPSPNTSATNTTPAVSGPRHLTGGVLKPKLTESELSARLAAARLNNAKREEAHRLAEADEASFQQREAQAREKRREEGAARRVMEGERERNRMRKLGAKGGREWDEGKKEEEVVRGRGNRRGMYGGVVGGVGAVGGDRRVGEAVGNEDDGGSGQGGYEGRGEFGGRRGRGRGRGGRGRGRGDSAGVNGAADGRGRGSGRKTPAGFVETDFPALSSGDGAQKMQTSPMEKISTLKNADILKSPTGEKGTWADQVEAGAAQTAALE